MAKILELNILWDLNVINNKSLGREDLNNQKNILSKKIQNLNWYCPYFLVIILSVIQILLKKQMKI